MNLGEQLQKLREEKKMSREELAGEMNVSRQAVYKWENNKGYPDIENLIKLSELCNVTLDELIKGDQSFQSKIAIDRKKSEDFSDPGFVVGIILVFVGLFLDLGTFSAGVTILGFLTMFFYEDLMKTFWSIKRDFKEGR
ncbi:helix-turn-helix domain-containing protein [Priestia megaterium]|uniref:helix-turn-helix domain-containing protein n=1 Tax=Priestia megaterium TaxID=1404 RepID=UPI000E146345|nr:helix-turn-helix transcriptional regulator [Priestia megaterium]QDZ79297.1 helix-turn-helix domain-containing protein [Priestia megaterium]TPF16700.1 transcriptional regulator [Priestia megaterium]TPF24326.1 transcriptional regulator [Priestia megaterium]SUV10547.1 transcriptional regulator [Priestia megaterium]